MGVAGAGIESIFGLERSRAAIDSSSFFFLLASGVSGRVTLALVEEGLFGKGLSEPCILESTGGGCYVELMKD